MKREAYEILYSLENELFTKYSKKMISWKQNVEVHKCDPNLGGVMYRCVNFDVSLSALPLIANDIKRHKNVYHLSINSVWRCG